MIFVDTSFWVALRNVRDAHHAVAVALLERHEHSGLVTSNHVRGETWTFLRRRVGHHAAVAFIDILERSPRVQVETMSAKQEHEALLWLRRHDEREYSFADAVSFICMRALRTTEALAFDGDFTVAGFTEVRL